MANSSFTLTSVLDGLAARGVPDPRKKPAGYANTVTLELANDAMADLITDRFNWKFNRATARSFYTNSWQQDYPQLAQPSGVIGWGEDCQKIDINNPMIPKPLWSMTWRRGLSRLSTQVSPVSPEGWQICWMYNSDLSYGAWPGPGIVFYPLVTTGVVQQNPIMSMIDSAGNLLILTTFGTTGSTAPAVPANSLEGVTVNDGSCVWTAVSGSSQGFRVWPLPNATGPVYQIQPSFQLDPPLITKVGQLLNPIPDSYIRHFRRSMMYQCKGASEEPADRAEFQKDYPMWLDGLARAMKQGEKEVNAYGLYPASSPVESIWDTGAYRGTADQPF